MQGEGTTRPKGSWWILSLYLTSKFMPDCTFGCLWKKVEKQEVKVKMIAATVNHRDPKPTHKV